MSLDENIKRLDDEGIYVFVAPEFDPTNLGFMGFTPHVVPYFGHEYVGNIFPNRPSAWDEALKVGEEMLIQKESDKPLTLF